LAPPRFRSSLRPARFVAAVGAVSVLTVGLTACGDSSSGSGSTSTTGRQANVRGAFSDPKVQACLKKEGVEVPDLRRGDANGPPPTGTDGQPPSGQRPPDGGFRDSAQGEKIRKALQKCGVTLPNRGQNGPPQRQDTTQADTANS
jgi:hypothetical protein